MTPEADNGEAFFNVTWEQRAKEELLGWPRGPRRRHVRRLGDTCGLAATWHAPNARDQTRLTDNNSVGSYQIGSRMRGIYPFFVCGCGRGDLKASNHIRVPSDNPGQEKYAATKNSLFPFSDEEFDQGNSEEEFPPLSASSINISLCAVPFLDWCFAIYCCIPS